MSAPDQASPLARPNRVLVVINPETGFINPVQLKQKIAAYLTTRGISFKVHATELDEDVSQTVRSAIQEGFDLFIAVGGDGTISEVANGIAGCSFPMAVVPNGTGNIIAKDLRIPLRADEALELIFASDRRVIRLDAMKVKLNYYILMVSAGFSANIFQHIRREDKRRLGILSYLWRGLLQLAGIQPTRFTLLVDGHKVRFSASDMIVMNSALIGWQPLKLDPEARMDDGKLSLCVLRARNLIDFISVAWNLLTRRQKQARELKILEVKERVEIRARRPVLVQGDGDVIGKTPVMVEFVPALIPFIVPQDYDRQD